MVKVLPYFYNRRILVLEGHSHFVILSDYPLAPASPVQQPHLLCLAQWFSTLVAQ